ncbi:hypothetical protein SLEP1_g46140 [Rubroshorea leprosula]|uniref:Uncharacterized protein n=1 Tax=Rubroshorea leprosula TaxID=152421 RepID=A0AAV5LM70_9ROSI|nr:hypothetical protein SLEP1_g46140 [Rubroshorea leprosula]
MEQNRSRGSPREELLDIISSWEEAGNWWISAGL